MCRRSHLRRPPPTRRAEPAVADPRLAPLAARLAGGDAAAAVALADALLADGTLVMPDRIAALVLRARAFEDMADRDRAIVDLEGALALDATQARIWNELGLVYADAGRPERAVGAFEHAVRVDRGYARGWNNLGNALRSQGRIADAVRAAEHATAADAGYVLAWANLGALRREAGDDAGAAVALRRALELAPDHVGALRTLGGLLRERSDLTGAAEAFRRVASFDSRDGNASLQLGATLAEANALPAAREALAEALRRDPLLVRAKLGERLMLPMIAAGTGAMSSAREDYTRGMTLLERELPAIASALAPERLQDELRHNNFLLAYQGEDDTRLQRRYGDLIGSILRAQAPEWRQAISPRVRAGSKVRVGFASAFFRDGTAGRYFEHWITGLPRDVFEVFVYHLLPQRDALTERLAARADRFRHMPMWRPSQAAPRIRADGLDILIYPELGMGAVTFALAALRLAPVQCAAWGHPVTSGHDTIDIFVSSAAMEPADGAQHYRESLRLLPGIGTRYPRPAVPADATRAAFGLPPGVPLLLCPQSLFKIHPDNDALYARILRDVPTAEIVLFEGREPQLTACFRARLEAGGIAGKRIRFLPQCGHDDYLRVNAVCDLMLDTLHWSGGNTSLDALACGLPMVTLPGRFMRGRQSAGMLKLMGLDELVVSDHDAYVRSVVELARDAARRQDLAARIRATHHFIFDDQAPIDALAALLREL